MPVKNVTPDYPPTFLLHGQEDTDVPHEQSAMMAAQFKQHGVAHQFLSIPKGEHGLAGADRQRVEEAYQAAVAFLRKHLDERMK